MTTASCSLDQGGINILWRQAPGVKRALTLDLSCTCKEWLIVSGTSHTRLRGCLEPASSSFTMAIRALVLRPAQHPYI